MISLFIELLLKKKPTYLIFSIKKLMSYKKIFLFNIIVHEVFITCIIKLSFGRSMFLNRCNKNRKVYVP